MIGWICEAFIEEIPLGSSEDVLNGRRLENCAAVLYRGISSGSWR
jgi:hypothetical protein